MNYQEAIDYLEGLNRFGIKLGLSRIARLLELLELPQNQYRTIHVTGSNGKGSVSAMLTSILCHSGIHTGFYSSPHLVSYTERMQVDGEMISEQDFADCLQVVKTAAEKMLTAGEECPTQFEVLTAIAFYYFAKRQVEYAVIEVGLGGLLDSTNVIVPEVSVITNVTLEHADRCGGTLLGIAKHKAGIIKDGVPVVTAATGEALQVIKQTAEAKNADVFVLGEDFRASCASYDANSQLIDFHSEILGIMNTPYQLHLLGDHQVENSALAVMTAQLIHNLDERVNEATIRTALGLVTWPARFEYLEYNGNKVIVDGAHNPAGITTLRRSLDKYFPFPRRVFLLGILKDKDIDSMLATLLRPDDVVVVTVPHSERAATADFLASKVAPLVAQVETVTDNEQALNRALALAGQEKLLIMAGSLYLVGGVRYMLLKRKG